MKTTSTSTSKPRVIIVLPARQRSVLANARRRALRNAPTVTYKVTRKQYRLNEPLLQRLARWEDVRAAVQSLLNHADRHPIYRPYDRLAAKDVIRELAREFVR